MPTRRALSDGKDWTWVLERPCADCGFAATDVPVEAVASSLAHHVALWQMVLRRGDARTRRRSDRWSDLEYACHVRDVLAIFADRIEQMLAESPTSFANWDQDAAARDADYVDADPRAVEAELAQAADRLADVLARIDEVDWDRRARRSNGSHFTLAGLVQYLRHDLEHHLVDVQARNAPGEPPAGLYGVL